MNVVRHVERGRREFGQRPALIFEGQTLSYAALDEQASQAAYLLRELGVGPRDCMAIFLPKIK